MTTERKYAANRVNAKASTGPKSEPGKAIARLNALTHGAFATQRLLHGEDASQYEQLSTSVLVETAPKSAIENMVVDQIIGDMWRVMRIERAEAAFFERLRETEYAQTLGDLPPEEFELAEKIVDNKEQLYTARQQQQQQQQNNNAAVRAAEYQRCKNLDSLLAGQSTGDSRPRLTSSEREVISNIVKRKLDETGDLGSLLLEAMSSDNRYAALENVRRGLVRDIVRQYANLLEIQERRLTIEPAQTE